jgi:putative phosphotransacetylase
MDERLIETIVNQVAERLLMGRNVKSDGVSELVTDEIRAGIVLVNISARHIHLASDHVEQLFGNGVQLKPMRPLHQPGEFASEQQVLLVGQAGRTLGPVRVLGPVRKASQVEISLTDCYTLGLKQLPPIRPSGDHTGTFGITMVGSVGAVTLNSGLIRANRHVHLHTTQAEAMGLRNGDLVDVRLDGERPAIFLGCQIRAHAAFRGEMHIDAYRYGRRECGRH